MIDVIERISTNFNYSVVHIFSTLGNGISLDHMGYITGSYRRKEKFYIPDPEPLNNIYPWSDTERFQPFRDLAGCVETGFPEVAKYFIECIRLSDPSVKDILDWQKNLHIVEDVLMNTPKIVNPYKDPDDIKKLLDTLSGLNTCYHKVPISDDGSAPDSPSSVQTIKLVETIWTDFPTEVIKEVKNLWVEWEFGNDHYYYSGTLNTEFFDDYPKIYLWLKHKGIEEDEKFLLHYWW